MTNQLLYYRFSYRRNIIIHNHIKKICRLINCKDASILDTPYTYEDLRAAGVMVGSGGMLVIDERTSVLDFLRMNQEFFWEESCGQCTPCREGNLHIKIILDKMAAGTATREDIAIMIKIARVMSMSSLCGLGETAQNSLMSAMKVFPDLFDIGGARA